MNRLKVKLSRGFQEFEDPRFRENRHMQMLRLSALGIGRLYAPGDTPDNLFC